MLWLGGDIEKKQLRRIGTYDGRFHTDEVIAIAILIQTFEVEPVRSGDEDILKEFDIVYTVGSGEFVHNGLDKQ